MLFDERMIWNYILFIEKIDDGWRIIHFVCWAWDSEWNIGIYSRSLVTKVNYSRVFKNKIHKNVFFVILQYRFPNQNNSKTKIKELTIYDTIYTSSTRLCNNKLGITDIRCQNNSIHINIRTSNITIAGQGSTNTSLSIGQ